MSYFSLGGQNEDDGDFLSPTPGAQLGGNSKLSSLFGMNQQMMKNPNSNQSLTYTAPKPPGKPDPEQKKAKPANNAPGVAYAVAVTAYKYTNNQHVKQGKLGAAILRNISANDYKILMYVTKQQPVSTAQITRQFTFVVQANNYASFYDDQRQSWNILFDNSEQLTEFSKQVCLAKFFSSPTSCESVVSQDLSPRDAKLVQVESGDSLEVKYTGWLVNHDGTLGGVFDSNEAKEKLFRFTTDKGKVIKGWEEGMMGMQKGGSRFLIIPPHLAYGGKSVGNKVPPNSTLAFKVMLLRMKQSKDSSSVKSVGSVESIPHDVAREQVVNEPPKPESHETTVKERTSSLNDQITQRTNEDEKSSIKQRMARMGQSLLPASSSHAPTTSSSYPPTSSSHPPTSSSHPPTSSHVDPHPKQHPDPIQNPPAQRNGDSPQITQHEPRITQPQRTVESPHNPQVTSTPPLYVPNDQPPPQHRQITASPLQPNPNYQPNQQHGYIQTPPHHNQLEQPYLPYSTYQPPMQMYHPHMQQSYGELPLLLSESRQHLTELRLIQDKIDKVSNLVQEVKDRSHDPMNMGSSQSMDATMVLHNIQRIVQENQHIKQQVLEKNKLIENQNQKINELLQQNQKHAEQSNLELERRNDSFKESFEQSQSRSLQLEQDKVELTQRLSESTSKVSELMLEISTNKQKDVELRQKFKEVYGAEKEKNEDLEEKVQELENQLAALGEKSSSVDEVVASSKVEIGKLENELVAVKSGLEESNKLLSEGAASWEEERRSLMKRLEDNDAMHARQLEELSSAHEVDQQAKITTLQQKLEAKEAKLEEQTSRAEEVESKLGAIQQKFIQLRGMYQVQSEKMTGMEDEVDEMAQYKEAYEKLRGQATMMKQKYEAKIEELQNNNSSEVLPTSNHFVQQVKQIMNSIFHRIKDEVSMEEEYDGGEVVQMVLRVIKVATLDMLSHDDAADSDNSDQSDDVIEKDRDADADDVASDVDDANSVTDVVGEVDHVNGDVTNPDNVIDKPPAADDVSSDVSSDVANDVANDLANDVANDVANDLAGDLAEDAGDVVDVSNETDDVNIKDDVDEASHINGADDVPGDVNDTDKGAEDVKEADDVSDTDQVTDDVNETYQMTDDVDKVTTDTDEPPKEVGSNDSNDQDGNTADHTTGGDQEKKGVSQDENTDVTPADQQNLNDVINATIEISSTRDLTREISTSSSHDDAREPPPLFDDDDSDDGINWLN